MTTGLHEALSDVLELQKKYSASKTPDMDKRAHLIKSRIPELLTDAAEQFSLEVQGSSGKGSNNRVTWVRVFNEDFSPRATDGWYAVFLFAADAWRPYQTSHTYANMVLAAGENPMWVAKQMGHTDWSLTARRYARWISFDMPDAGQKAGTL